MFLDDLFPGEKTVFAAWFTGEIILTQGKILKLKSNHSPTVYENDLHLEISNGLLIRTYLVENTRETISGYYDNINHGGARLQSESK